MVFVFVFVLDDEEAHDTAVTWHVTWCDIIGPEHGGLEANMRMKHGYEGRSNY